AEAHPPAFQPGLVGRRRLDRRDRAFRAGQPLVLLELPQEIRVRQLDAARIETVDEQHQPARNLRFIRASLRKCRSGCAVGNHAAAPWEGGRPRPPFREIANATFAAREMAGEDAGPPWRDKSPT